MNDPPPAAQTPLGDATPDQNPLDAFANMTVAASGVVDQVIDPRTLLLDDGTIVHLMGIDMPGVAYDPPSPTALMAFDYVQRTIKGQKAKFYQPAGQSITTNRYRHLLAWGVRADNGEWLQEKMIEGGYARIWDGDATGADLTPLLAAEDKARTASAGIWQEGSMYREFTPTNIPVTSLGQITVVTGTVKSVLTLDNNIILSMTDTGRNGFHLSIPSALRPAMAQQNFDPFALEGKTIRARGVVRASTAAYIDILHLWQIDVLSGQPAGGGQ